MRKLKIGIDAKRLFNNQEGLGSFSRTLVHNLVRYYPQHHYYLFTTGTNTKIQFAVERYQNCTIILPPQGSNPSWWRRKSIVNDLNKLELDVYLGLSNELPHGISKTQVSSIVFIHDLLSFDFKKQFNFIDRLLTSLKIKKAISEADLIIAASHYTKERIQSHFSKQELNVFVIYQPVNHDIESAKMEAQKNEAKHFLFVGSLNERKNPEYLIEGFKLLDEKDRRPLIIVGRGGQYATKLKAKVSASELKDWITFLERIDDKDLIQLYRESIALVFPSKMEGFGIPPLEALSLSVPVIHPLNSSIPEVVGKHGIVIDLNDVSSLKEAMLLVLKGGNNREENSIKTHLSQFDSQLITEKIMDKIFDLSST